LTAEAHIDVPPNVNQANNGVPPNVKQLLESGGPLTLNWAGEANIGVLQYVNLLLASAGSQLTINWTFETNIVVPSNVNQLLDSGGLLTLNWAGEANIGVLQNGDPLLDSRKCCQFTPVAPLLPIPEKCKNEEINHGSKGKF